MKRKILVVLGLVAFLGVGLTGYTTALEQDVINATVTVSIIAITFDEDTVAYGVVNVGSTDNEPSPAFFTATNTGSVAEDFNIKGADTAAWTLVQAATGTDEYRHRASTDAFVTQDDDLTTGFLGIATNVLASNTETIHLRLDAPAGTAVTAEQTAVVTVQAVAN